MTTEPDPKPSDPQLPPPEQATTCRYCEAPCVWRIVNHCRAELIDLATGERHWLGCPYGQGYRSRRRDR